MDEITLQIMLTAPPAGVSFCLQNGHGHDFTLFKRQVSKGDDLVFHVSVKLKTSKTGEPDFAGPFVEGSAGALRIALPSNLSQDGELLNKRV